MQLITNQQDFDDLITKLLRHTILFMDTEFYRRTTYYANLCLIQIATKSDQFIIDVLSGINISRLSEILLDKKIIKVFHSCEQDIQILHEILRIMPRNIFDTQIAASACGLGASMSYQNLCYKLLDVQLDKTLQNTDWQKRPLSQQSIDYAVSDVLHLVPLHDKLSSILRSSGGWKNYKEQISKLITEDRLVSSPEKLMNRIKTSDISNKQEIDMLDLIAFREECAKELNIPRQHFLTDKELLKIAKALPQNTRILRDLGINMFYINKKGYAQKLIDMCTGLSEK